MQPVALTHLALDDGCRRAQQLWNEGKRDEAIAAARILSEAADETYGVAHGLMGQFMAAVFEWDSAATYFGEGVLREPENLAIWTNLASALSECGRLVDAVYAATSVLTVLPHSHAARYAMGHAQLRCGCWEDGWANFEQGYYLDKFTARCPGVGKLWHGEKLHGDRLMIHWSQGLGDTVQFLRFVPMILDQADECRAYLEVQPQLVDLCRRAFGDRLEVVAYDHNNPAKMPQFDYKIDLMHAPYELRLKEDHEHTMREPYIGMDVPAAELPGDGFRVGIAWQGNRDQERDHLRSIPYSAMSSLVSASGCSFYSIQKGERCGDPRVVDLSDCMPTLTEAVSYLKAMDLFITVDTGIAHVALAAGVRTWALLQPYADWRWMDRERTTWYPDAQLFHGSKNGEWQQVLDSVKSMIEVVRR